MQKQEEFAENIRATSGSEKHTKKIIFRRLKVFCYFSIFH
jgi:hypothetical protein